MDFPAGHSANNATLPIGGWVELDADRHRVTVLEEPVR
jgi:muramoyltetrapeptide carboxypeptidase LdcA involved in peptidoglycan recycling